MVIQVIAGLVLLILGGIGAAVGVTVSKKTSNDSSSSSSSVVTENNNDPSNFEKNSALKQSFYGIAYTPEGSQLPECGNSLGEYIRIFAPQFRTYYWSAADVITDIQLLSQLTTVNIYFYAFPSYGCANGAGSVFACMEPTATRLSSS